MDILLTVTDSLSLPVFINLLIYKFFMNEIENKYTIYEKKFGYINWIGFWTLYKKEVLRFLIVIIQTVISPLVTSLLFLVVLSVAIGDERGEVLGFPFINFLAPGLIAM